MSQERMDAGIGQRLNNTTDYHAPDIEATINRAQNSLKQVRVVSGANEQYHSLEGKTVGSVRKSLRDVFNIPGDAVALVGGKEVGDDFILEGGQNLEFLKEAGVKGSKRVFLRNIDSGEPACYCGSVDDMDDVITSIRHVLESELPEEIRQHKYIIDYRLEIQEMTDEEVDDLPDL